MNIPSLQPHVYRPELRDAERKDSEATHRRDILPSPFVSSKWVGAESPRPPPASPNSSRGSTPLVVAPSPTFARRTSPVAPGALRRVESVGTEIAIGDVTYRFREGYIYSGALSDVRRADRVDCESARDRVASVAVKRVPKTEPGATYARREAETLRYLGASDEDNQHMYVVRLIDAFEDKSNIYIVTEFLEGEALIDRLLRKDAPKLDLLGRFYEIVLAVNYCHARGVAHRDLKADNVMLTPVDDENAASDKDAELQCKLIDFGFARRLEAERPAHTPCGTYGYNAPELSLGVASETISYPADKVDIWALGVILFSMLTGAMPFPKGDTPAQMRARVDYCRKQEEAKYAGRARLPPSPLGTLWQRMATLPDAYRELLLSLWHPDPSLRPDTPQILAHLNRIRAPADLT